MDTKFSSKCDHLPCKYLDKVEGKYCEECGGTITNTIPEDGFACQRCGICLHRSCAVKMRRDLSHEVMHPLHPQHRLELKWSYREYFICDKCLYISAGYTYTCDSCHFFLDLACASSANDELPTDDQEPLRKTIRHHSHGHDLSIFKYRKIHQEDLDCFWCEKHLSGVCYGCFDIPCCFFLHPACSDKIPRKLAHPFHPGHPLRLSYINGSCYACGRSFFASFSHSPGYRCDECGFLLDMDCVKLFPTLKLDCHPHILTYFGDSTSMLYCRICFTVLDGASICHCMQCNFSFHPKCVLKSEAISRYHRHPLTLTESVKEDDSDEFYCDVCENERNPKHPVYYCQGCTFVAHIQCVLDEAESSSSMKSEEALSVKEKEQNEGTNVTHYLFRPIIHDHRMYKVTEELKAKRYCNGCRLVLDGASYFCKQCPAGFYLHEKCAKLKYEIQHPFHPTHPLYLYASYRHPSWNHRFVQCDECKDLCRGFIYFCEQCNFKVDVKCAALTAHKTGVSQEKKMDGVTELQHLSHEHKLFLGYCNDPIRESGCTICELSTLGRVYFCPQSSCSFIVHESCLRLPQKIQLPFHLKHMLVIQQPQEHSNPQCYACPLNLKSFKFAYSCEECQLNLHPVCANSLKRPLKCESHLDDLYYFGKDYQFVCANSIPSCETHFACHKCEISCQGEPFYRCLKCSINFHLKCVPIPDVVESKYHRHPLTLKDYFVEDDSQKYYCDFCEEERNPRDHVYYCKECDGQTIAHIECVLTRQVEDVNCEERLQKKRREGIRSQPIQLENFPAMVIGVWTDDTNLQLKATTQFRELLSVETSLPIDEVVRAGVVPRFVEFLERDDFPQLQFEAAWSLTNIASGTSENTKVVIVHGAVPIFIKLLASPSADVREQSIWALGNVAGDSPTSRDVVLGHGALLPLLAHLNEHAKLSVLRIATWTLSNFCQGKPQPRFDQVKLALPTLAHLIHSNDEEVLSDACWALSYLSDGTNDEIQAVIEAGVCGRLVELLLHPSLLVLKPALRTVRNIVTGDDVQTQCIISHQALPCLSKLLTNKYKMSIKKEACRTISNITAKNKEQIQAVIEANIIAPLVHLLKNAETLDMKGEAAQAISYATSRGTDDQINFLVSQDCFKPLCDLLNCRDPRIVKVCLEGLKNIMKVGGVARVISCVTSHETHDQTRFLVSQGCIMPLCDLLYCIDLSIVGVCLEWLENILKVGEDENMCTSRGMNPYARMIGDALTRERIENLLYHANSKISEKAWKVYEKCGFKQRQR